LKTDKITIFDLFEIQRRYLVPIFQRGYVWTMEGQWQPLWEDIIAQTAQVVLTCNHSGIFRISRGIGFCVVSPSTRIR
jgi:hypothetical protein